MSDCRRSGRARWAVIAGAALALLLHCTTAQAQGRAGGLTEEEQAFQSAEAAFKENRDEEALKLYERVNNMNPARTDAYMKRAVILYKRKEFAAAVVVLTRARELLPDEPSLTGQLGLTLYRLNKTDAAVAFLEQAVARTPDAYQLQLQLGQHYVKVGDGKRAVDALEAYFKARPESAAVQDPQVRAFSGAAYYLNKQYPEAQRDLESVLRVFPTDTPARVTLAAVYTARGDWSRGVALYETLGGEAGKQPLIHENLATCYQHLHRLPEAEREAVAYTTARPQDARGFLLLGDIRADRKDTSGALEAWAGAKRLDPTAEVPARQGQVLLAQKRWAEAAAALEEARKARPAGGGAEDLAVLTGLADAYAAMQQTAQTREKLTGLAGELGKRAEPEAQLGAGVAHYAIGEDDKAITAFTAAIGSPRTRSRARGGLRLSLNRRAGGELGANNLAAAHKTLETALSADPDSVVTARNLGLVLLLEGRYADAEKALGKAHQRVESDVVVNRLLGRAAAQQGRPADAVKYLEVAAQSAQKARGPALAEVYADLGPLYTEQQRYDLAVNALDTAVKEAGSKPVHDAASRNLAFALLRRGLGRLADSKEADAGLEDIARAAALRGGLSTKETGAIGCAYALAALKAGKPSAAVEALGRATREGGCNLRAPYDKIGLELFSAYAGYREGGNPARREATAHALQKVAPRATGALADTVRDLTRSSYEYEGVDLYGRGDRKRAEVALRNAQKMTGRGEHRELDHNLAVLDLDAGRTADAGRVFEQLGNRPPEALVNLGVLRDREGDSKKALDLYKRALERGARTPHLREWIDVKERVFARAGAASGAPAGSTGGGK